MVSMVSKIKLIGREIKQNQNTYTPHRQSPPQTAESAKSPQSTHSHTFDCRPTSAAWTGCPNHSTAPNPPGCSSSADGDGGGDGDDALLRWNLYGAIRCRHSGGGAWRPNWTGAVCGTFPDSTPSPSFRRGSLSFGAGCPGGSGGWDRVVGTGRQSRGRPRGEGAAGGSRCRRIRDIWNFSGKEKKNSILISNY